MPMLGRTFSRFMTFEPFCTRTNGTRASLTRTGNSTTSHIITNDTYRNRRRTTINAVRNVVTITDSGSGCKHRVINAMYWQISINDNVDWDDKWFLIRRFWFVARKIRVLYGVGNTALNVARMSYRQFACMIDGLIYYWFSGNKSLKV